MARDEIWRKYHAQKRLAEALFGLFRTLGTTLSVEQVARAGLLSLMGQLLIKSAAFFGRDDDGDYRETVTIGTRTSEIESIVLTGDSPPVTTMLQRPTVQPIPSKDRQRPELELLYASGFRALFPLISDEQMPGIILLGEKVVPQPFTDEDLQILDAFAVVIGVSLRNSKAYEVLAESRNELQRLNELKREFLGHVSHEFRSPLTVLKSISEMLDLEPEIEELQCSAMARLEHLVNSILLLNEINARGVQLDLSRVNGPEWLQTRVRPMLKRHGRLELHSTLPPCTVEFDRFKFETALESIIDNAAKFGPNDEKVQVAAYLKKCDSLESAPSDVPPRPDQEPRPPSVSGGKTCLVIEVKDRGMGIPNTDLNTVFQPFTQAGNSPTLGVRGVGLGLTIVKRIIEAHGGRVLVRSAVGQGTDVMIIIPGVRTEATKAVNPVPSRQG